ncbi:hypothetical protein ACFQU9_01745 [Actinomadura namibiensis]|uniref:Uncharacterized protein n=1 Tax=Actinomadura namibiensis TaxID=182080 RepID=A0A7W3LMX3_ACTNM|nr:hypothetical protein [Actinomadura namibiensis]MBA8951069.1 hypothetical protein [Actinomadura namibiensis]
MLTYRFGASVTAAAVAFAGLTAMPAQATTAQPVNAQVAVADVADVTAKAKAQTVKAYKPVVHKRKGKKGKYVYAKASWTASKKSKMRRVCVYLVWAGVTGPQMAAGNCLNISAKSKGSVTTSSVRCGVWPMRVEVFGLTKGGRQIARHSSPRYTGCGG